AAPMLASRKWPPPWMGFCDMSRNSHPDRAAAKNPNCFELRGPQIAATLTMPSTAADMAEGKLGRWLVDEGDKVAAGDVIAEIETDKATMEFEAPAAGIVARILVAAGSE